MLLAGLGPVNKSRPPCCPEPDAQPQATGKFDQKLNMATEPESEPRCLNREQTHPTVDLSASETDWWSVLAGSRHMHVIGQNAGGGVALHRDRGSASAPSPCHGEARSRHISNEAPGDNV